MAGSSPVDSYPELNQTQSTRSERAVFRTNSRGRKDAGISSPAHFFVSIRLIAFTRAIILDIRGAMTQGNWRACRENAGGVIRDCAT
jgi:hypothetical protein